jgi:flavin reductase (DIM6/NTAB) family NADH-FMN oxidoreductase RutF
VVLWGEWVDWLLVDARPPAGHIAASSRAVYGSDVRVELSPWTEVHATPGEEGLAMSETLVALFRRITAGVYVVGVAHGEQRNAFTAAWLIQASFDPLLLALSINPGHASYGLLKAGGSFTVNVLHEADLDVARHFGTHSGREGDKLAGIAWHPGRSGAPILARALAYFECQVTGSVPAGDHEIVLGRVIDGRLVSPEAVPLTYGQTGDMDGSSQLYPRGF